MSRPPLILMTGCLTNRGAEFADSSLSLSNRYALAITRAGGMPLAVPFNGEMALVARYVALADGLLLTGGDDMLPKYYAQDLPLELAQKIHFVEPERDELELALIDEVFKQRKPLLCICRGHQVVNVALGGGMIVDISTERPDAIKHRDKDIGPRLTHEVDIEPGSLLASVLGGTRLPVNSSHHQAPGRVADRLRVTAKTDDGIVEGLELKDPAELPYFLSVQFHPERHQSGQPGSGNIFTSFVEACGVSNEMRTQIPDS